MNEFKTRSGKNILHSIDVANNYQSLHIGCNHYEEINDEKF
jgi:hypothetical protein